MFGLRFEESQLFEKYVLLRTLTEASGTTRPSFLKNDQQHWQWLGLKFNSKDQLEKHTSELYNQIENSPRVTAKLTRGDWLVTWSKNKFAKRKYFLRNRKAIWTKLWSKIKSKPKLSLCLALLFLVASLLIAPNFSLALIFSMLLGSLLGFVGLLPFIRIFNETFIRRAVFENDERGIPVLSYEKPKVDVPWLTAICFCVFVLLAVLIIAFFSYYGFLVFYDYVQIAESLAWD